MRREQDHLTRKAKASGYPARSVHKLIEIQERFDVLKSGMRVLDLGASPGSWSLYASRIVGPAGRIVAVDLKNEIVEVLSSPFTFVEGDMHDSAVRSSIRELGSYDCILSDAAPSTTGNRTVDTARSEALVDSAIAYCDTCLAAGGNFVVKLFQGDAVDEVFMSIRNRFSTAKRFKPTSSRKSSFEIFCVGIGHNGS